VKLKRGSLLWLTIIWIGAGCILLLCSNPISATDGEYTDSRTNLHLFIPDATEDSCGNWRSDTINVTGQSSRAYVTSVDVAFTIDHTYLSDLVVDLWHPDSTEHGIWDNDGSYSPYCEEGITVFNGKSVNGKWILWVCDCGQNDTGYFEAWELTIYYTIPPPSAPTNLTVSGRGDGKVSLSWDVAPETDCDGYYAYWDTDSTVSTSNCLDSAYVPGRTNNSYTVNPSPYGLHNGVTYDFVITTSDWSGNRSSESNKVNGAPHESMVADYPWASWVPAYWENYTNMNRSYSVIDTVVIHVAQGYYQGTIDEFRYENLGHVSAHYVISSSGAITQMVHHNNIAHHALGHNNQTIGIEHEGFKDSAQYFTDDMYRESADLVRYICHLYNIPKDTFHIIGHNKISTKPCPGTLWNWKKYMRLISGTYAPEEEMIWDYYLSQNYPNPFNAITSINYNVKTKGKVNLTVYNILGRKVRTLVNQVQNLNRYEVIWDGRDDSGKELSTGIYFCRFKAGDFEELKKMCFLK